MNEHVDGANVGFLRLVRWAAPLWSGEAEVFETYFGDRERTVAADRRWIERQCYKELVDGVEPRLAALGAGLDSMGDPEELRQAIRDAEELEEELRHLAAFVEAHRLIGGSDHAPPLDMARLRRSGGWVENDELGRARARHRRLDPSLGVLAQAFTEGGCCTLYAAGMALPDDGPHDRAIAAACRAVYDDEIDHMRAGRGGLARHDLDPRGWATLTEFVVDQLQLRIAMRNAQFDRPLGPGRLRELCAGAAQVRPDTLARVGVTPDQLAAVATSST